MVLNEKFTFFLGFYEKKVKKSETKREKMLRKKKLCSQNFKTDLKNRKIWSQRVNMRIWVFLLVGQNSVLDIFKMSKFDIYRHL